MAQNLHSPEVYDFRQYDRVWQRVAPDLEPYPSANVSAAVPASQPPQAPSAGQLARQESQLPGAAQNPCCMGSAAAEMLEVLTGFIEEELADRRYFLALSRQAPAWARQRLPSPHRRRHRQHRALVSGSAGAIPHRGVQRHELRPLRGRHHGSVFGKGAE